MIELEKCVRVSVCDVCLCARFENALSMQADHPVDRAADHFSARRKISFSLSPWFKYVQIRTA